MDQGYQPIFETIRGKTVESVHFGAAAVVDTSGNLLAWYGDPRQVTFMRSSAKPLQVLLLTGGDTIALPGNRSQVTQQQPGLKMQYAEQSHSSRAITPQR